MQCTFYEVWLDPLVLYGTVGSVRQKDSELKCSANSSS